MPGIADFALPSYLDPMSEAQSAQANEGNARIGLQSKEIAVQAAASAQRAAIQRQEVQQRDMLMKEHMAETLQRKQTMARIQGRITELSALPGMDQAAATDQAMLENADSIWDNHPEAMAQGVNSLMSRINRRQAVAHFQADSSSLLRATNPKTGEPYTAEEATMEAYWKNIGSLDETAAAPGSLIGQAVRGSQTVDWRKAALQRQERNDTWRKAASDAGLQLKANLGYDNLDEKTEHNLALEANQKQANTDKNTRSEQYHEDRVMKDLSTDPTLRDLNKRREDLQKKIDARKGGPSELRGLAQKIPGAGMVGVSQEAYEKATDKLLLDAQELDERIAARELKLRNNPPAATTPKATPADGRVRMVKPDGTIGTLPASRVEEAESANPPWKRAP